MLIFFLSSQSIFPINPPRIPYLDKMCHMTEFAILGFLLIRALMHEQSPWVKKNALPLAIVITLLFGLSDEFHQLFVPLRRADGLDLLADGLGALIGSWGALWMYWLMDRRQRKGHE